MSEEIQCVRCLEPKPSSSYYTNRTGGREYRRKTCRECDNTARKLRGVYQPRTDHRREIERSGGKRRRRDPKFVAQHILMDSRKSDKLVGRENDLDKVWIDEVIKSGCSYCGEQEIRMTLDRIDNSLGHLKSNVRPACGRCNYLRRDMPFSAWLMIVPSVRVAREAGAFKTWNGFRAAS